MMLDKIQRQTKIVEDTVKAQQSEAGIEPSDGEEMGVSIGNENHYHGKQNGWALPMAALLGGAITGASLLYGLSQGTGSGQDKDTLTNVTAGFGTPVNREGANE